MTAVLLAGLLLLGQDQHARPADAGCFVARVTGYSRYEFSSHTYDGTPILTPEPIVAASWDIPLGHYVDLEGLGRFRVADRGMLGSSGWFDVAVWSRQEAFSITGHRRACVFPPEELQ